jgi:hypothetical protein
MLRPEYQDMIAVGDPSAAEQTAGDDASTLVCFAALIGRRLDWKL